MNKVIKKRGRPTEHPKTGLVKFRSDIESINHLDYCCKVLTMSKSEVLRMSVEKLYNELLEKNTISRNEE